MMISNRISLDELRRMAVGDIAALPAEQLVLLQDEAADALRRAKTVCDWLDGAVALKYGDRAHAARQTAGKDTGTVQFEDRHHIITVEIPKKVVWDDEILAGVIAKIPVKERDEYVTTSYKIEENKYKHWPRRLQDEFKPARTVKTGKPKIAVKEYK